MKNVPVMAGSSIVDVEVTVARIVRAGRVCVARSVSVTAMSSSALFRSERKVNAPVLAGSGMDEVSVTAWAVRVSKTTKKPSDCVSIEMGERRKGAPATGDAVH